LNNEDLIGSHHKTPRPVRYNDHNIGSVLVGRSDTLINNNLGSVLAAKHQGRSDTSISNNQQPTHDKPTSFAQKQILGKKKKKKTSLKLCWNFSKALKQAGDKQNMQAVLKTEEKH
jgi:hypothetical protein